MVVHQLEDVDPSVRGHGETNYEHQATNTQCYPLSNINKGLIFFKFQMCHDIRPVIAPEFWELIQKNCDNSLSGGDLSSKAQQEQHEEE